MSRDNPAVLCHTKTFSKTNIVAGPQQRTNPVTIATVILSTFFCLFSRCFTALTDSVFAWSFLPLELEQDYRVKNSYYGKGIFYSVRI